MGRSDDRYRLVSIPHRVFWGGWETTTTQMQQCGWELSADHDIYRMGVRLCFKSEDFGIFGFTGFVRVDEMFRAEGVRQPLMFQVVRMGALRGHFVHSIENVNAFVPIDAYPQTVASDTIQELDKFSIFATPLARTEPIIVEPHDVMRMLERIRELQMPEQAAIRARNRTREYMKEGSDLVEPVPRQRFHAQILSIAA